MVAYVLIKHLLRHGAQGTDALSYARLLRT